MVAGIPGSVSLEAWSDVRLDYVYTEQKHAADKCVVRVFAECQAAHAGEYELRVSIGDVAASRKVRLAAGHNRPSLEVTVMSPKLWWPNGYGEPNLYDLKVRMGGHAVSKRIGLRTIELVNKEDKSGLSMIFRVNGIDVFCKGANWIPPDALPQRETRNKLAHLLESARFVHMNMLRIWGGGRYETDDFYAMCDEKGIMLWHDMMFSCALYPATPSFLANVEREIRGWFAQCRPVAFEAAMLIRCPDRETALRIIGLAKGSATAVSDTMLVYKDPSKQRAALIKKLKSAGMLVSVDEPPPVVKRVVQRVYRRRGWGW